MKTIKVSQVQKTKKIEGLKVGDKIFASLATWYKKSEWGKTPYGSMNSLKQRFLEGVVNEIRQRKLAPRHKIFKIKRIKQGVILMPDIVPLGLLSLY